jgi:hypothetical protein
MGSNLLEQPVSSEEKDSKDREAKTQMRLRKGRILKVDRVLVQWYVVFIEVLLGLLGS